MNYRARIRRLQRRLAPRPRNPVPSTEAEFYEGLIAGRFTVEDIDRRNYNHMTWLATLAAELDMLIARGESNPHSPLSFPST